MIANRRTGPTSSRGPNMRPNPAPAAAAELTNRNGSSRYPSCHAGTAVSAINAAV
jgi:hypothetical protein